MKMAEIMMMSLDAVTIFRCGFLDLSFTVTIIHSFEGAISHNVYQNNAVHSRHYQQHILSCGERDEASTIETR